MSTRRTYEGYINRTILPALGSMELRKVRGPLLDTFYARLRRCTDLSCNGRPFVEHVSFPPLEVVVGSRTAWLRVVESIREAIGTGQLPAGEQLPSAREMYEWYGLRLTTAQRVLAVLSDEGLIEVRRGAGLSSATGLLVARRSLWSRPRIVARSSSAGRISASRWRL